MRELKFRAWDEKTKTMSYSGKWWQVLYGGTGDDIAIGMSLHTSFKNPQYYEHGTRSMDELVIEQCVGLSDKSGDDWYHNDTGEFDNGDKFVIKQEAWMEFYAEWVGEPECEDQTRDFYRLENATKTGNIHEDTNAQD